MAQFPDLTAQKSGRDVLLTFEDDRGAILKAACEKEYDDEAVILAKAASIV